MSWLLWLTFLVVTVAYAGELIQESRTLDWTVGMLLLQLLLAALVVAPLALVVVTLSQKIETGTLGRRVCQLLFWTPRSMVAVFAALLTLLALDVFGAGHGPWQTLLALLIHLAPAGGMLIVLALAWRWPLVGTVALCVWAVWYLGEAFGRFPLSVYAIVMGLPLVQAILFMFNWWLRRELTDCT